MILTKKFIMEHRTERGGWTKFQLKAVGITWPAYKGWIDDVIGKEISEVEARRFILGKQVLLNRGLIPVRDVLNKMI